MQVDTGPDEIVVRGSDYSLRLPADASVLSRAPYATLADAAGETWSRLNLLASAGTLEGADETFGIESVTVELSSPGEDDSVRLSIASPSSRWAKHVVEVLCTDGGVAVRLRITGEGRLDEVTLLGGEATLPSGSSGTFRSSIGFPTLLVPSPTEPVQFVRPSASGAQLGVVGDADPGRLNGIFSPPPLVLGLGRAALAGPTVPPVGDWLAMGVRDAVERLTFTTLRYEPLDGGFLLRLRYEGHTAVDGEWMSPAIVIAPAESGWGVIDAHRADLAAHGFAPQAAVQQQPSWWREPLFCGWGAQCARSAELQRLGAAPVSAPDLASAALYDEFVATLGDAGLDPGTIVIDDRWQAEYGTGTAHPDRWPDLRGWIADQHAAGRKVLLWWKAWDPEGLPAEECVLDAVGSPVAADPANPAYRDRLAAIIAHLVSPDGLDADGFKVDFTQRAPSGRSLVAHPGAWGIAALHLLLGTIHRAAHSAKPDALVVTHAVHPSFASVTDMVRLNDVLERDVGGARVSVVDQLEARYEIAARSQPGHLIDTDQWPMPSKAEWLAYADRQAQLGVPALYYLESIDNSGEKIDAGDLARIAETWKGYRAHHGLARR